MSKTWAIIVAAGRGTRSGLSGPKQYATISGQTVLAKTLAAFQACEAIDAIQVVIHADDRELYDTSLGKRAKLAEPVVGGLTRQASVLQGLLAIQDCDRVLIHDAARPFVSSCLIETVCDAIINGEGGVPALPVSDSLRRAVAERSETVPRDDLYAVQTPQGFRFASILAAHEAATARGRDDFTDDAGLAEWFGIDVALVPGEQGNMKLTTAEDMEKAGQTAVPDVRVGHGYDTHQLVAGDEVILCGVVIPHDRKLDGHSDADVGLHALTDAILATIGAGDIGDHFPPTDEKWRGAASDQFLVHAAALVRKEGGTLTHVDVTLLCEQPKIGLHRAAMRARIGDILGLAADRVSVKATTNERVGFIGREEGIVALATATVVFT